MFNRRGLMIVTAGVFCIACYSALNDRQAGEGFINEKVARADVYYYASQYDEAAEAYRIALKTTELLESQKQQVMIRLAYCLHRGQHFDEAIKAYQDIMDRYPTTLEANKAEGEIERIRLNRGIE